MAHNLGFFNSVGLSAHYSIAGDSPTSNIQSLVHAALAKVIGKHSILSAIPVNEDSPNPHWARLPSIDLSRCVSFIDRKQSRDELEQDPELDNILENAHNTNFQADLGELPFWRVIIVKDTQEEREFTASFVYYHGIGDGAAGLIFHQSFRGALDIAQANVDELVDVSTLVQVSTDIHLLPTLEEAHPLPLNPSPKAYKRDGVREWVGNIIQVPSTTLYRSLYLSKHSTTKFLQRCKSNGVTVTSGLQSVMAHAIFDALPDTVEALTGIIPVNLRPWLDLPPEVAKDAMGSYIDAIKVQICRDHYKHSDLAAATYTAECIKDYLSGNPSPTGEPYTSVAFFKALPDLAAVFKLMIGADRDSAFEISNIGRTEDVSESTQWRIGRMTFSRSAVAMGAALTTSVVTGGDMATTISFSWQDSVIKNSLVDSIVTNFLAYFNKDTP